MGRQAVKRSQNIFYLAPFCLTLGHVHLFVGDRFSWTRLGRTNSRCCPPLWITIRSPFCISSGRPTVSSELLTLVAEVALQDGRYFRVIPHALWGKKLDLHLRKSQCSGWMQSPKVWSRRSRRVNLYVKMKNTFGGEGKNTNDNGVRCIILFWSKFWINHFPFRKLSRYPLRGVIRSVFAKVSDLGIANVRLEERWRDFGFYRLATEERQDGHRKLSTLRLNIIRKGTCGVPSVRGG